MFLQWTGINAVVFFSPFIFQSMGDRFKGELGSLLATVIVGAVQVSKPYCTAHSYLPSQAVNKYSNARQARADIPASISGNSGG